jgi:hypothetical protein
MITNEDGPHDDDHKTSNQGHHTRRKTNYTPHNKDKYFYLLHWTVVYKLTNTLKISSEKPIVTGHKSDSMDGAPEKDKLHFPYLISYPFHFLTFSKFYSFSLAHGSVSVS